MMRLSKKHINHYGMEWYIHEKMIETMESHIHTHTQTCLWLILMIDFHRTRLFRGYSILFMLCRDVPGHANALLEYIQDRFHAYEMHLKWHSA
jgi:hypothetical protein